MSISAQPLFLFDGLAHRQLLLDALEGRGQKEKKVCVFPTKLACEGKATAINKRASSPKESVGTTTSFLSISNYAK